MPTSSPDAMQFCRKPITTHLHFQAFFFHLCYSACKARLPVYCMATHDHAYSRIVTYVSRALHVHARSRMCHPLGLCFATLHPPSLRRAVSVCSHMTGCTSCWASSSGMASALGNGSAVTLEYTGMRGVMKVTDCRAWTATEAAIMRLETNSWWSLGSLTVYDLRLACSSSHSVCTRSSQLVRSHIPGPDTMT